MGFIAERQRHYHFFHSSPIIKTGIISKEGEENKADNACNIHMSDVVIIDDSEQFARPLMVECAERGIAASWVSQPAEALSAVAKEKPKLVLLDVVMGQEHGLSLLEKIQKEADVPVVIVSNFEKARPIVEAQGVPFWSKNEMTLEMMGDEIAKRVQGNSASGGNRGGNRVLIIDDDMGFATPVRLALEEAGYVVEHALNGALGRRVAQSFHPDVVVLDIMMPGEHGLRALDEMKDDPELHGVPIIVSTNLEKSAPLVRGKADAFILKSETSVQQIVQTVKRMAAREHSAPLPQEKAAP